MLPVWKKEGGGVHHKTDFMLEKSHSSVTFVIKDILLLATKLSLTQTKTIKFDTLL